MEFKNFKVNFKRGNGTIGSDTFMAINASEAVKDFKECYRHDVYEIISVETETYKNEDRKCECLKCEMRDSCIHNGAFRRLPKEVGGLGLCKKLQ